MKLIKQELVHNGFLKVFKNTYQTGKQILGREILERGDSVAAVVYNTEEELYYFVSQPRPATFEKHADPDNFVEVIAGMIDDDETALDAIEREIEEELGFTYFTNINFIGEFFLSPGGCSERIFLFEVTTTNKNKINTTGVGDESIEVVTFTKEQLKNQVFYDAKTIIAVQYLNLKQ